MSEDKIRRKNGPGLSLTEFGKKSGLHFRRVARAVERGEIATVQLGGIKRIPESELERVKRMFQDAA